MSGLHLPPAEPPDELAAAALETLAGGREEMRAAAHTLALVKIGARDEDDNPPASSLFMRRREIELRVAELRVTLWSEELRRLENDVRRHGIRP